MRVTENDEDGISGVDHGSGHENVPLGVVSGRCGGCEDERCVRVDGMVVEPMLI